MTAPSSIDPATGPSQRAPATGAAVRALAGLEARRNLAAPWLWLGIALTVTAMQQTLGVDYAAGGYQGVIASFGGVAAGLFVLGALAGGRDRAATEGATLAPESVLDADHRAVARLLGLVPALAIGVLVTAVVFVVARVEGGFWVGDAPGRTDTAQHGPFEILQPVALLLLAATAGVALGRATAQRTLVCVVGALTVLVFGFFSWAWQGEPVRYATLLQTQPFETPITWPGGRVDFTALPSDWLLSAPDAYDDRWAHVVIDQRIAAAHDAYLLGLAAVATGLAVRSRAGRPLVAAGAAVAVVAVAAQIVL